MNRIMTSYLGVEPVESGTRLSSEVCVVAEAPKKGDAFIGSVLEYLGVSSVMANRFRIDTDKVDISLHSSLSEYIS
jgi:hypothetical protein